jgi:hypothetical protein
MSDEIPVNNLATLKARALKSIESGVDGTAISVSYLKTLCQRVLDRFPSYLASSMLREAERETKSVVMVSNEDLLGLIHFLGQAAPLSATEIKRSFEGIDIRYTPYQMDSWTLTHKDTVITGPSVAECLFRLDAMRRSERKLYYVLGGGDGLDPINLYVTTIYRDSWYELRAFDDNDCLWLEVIDLDLEEAKRDFSAHLLDSIIDISAYPR